MKHAFTASFLLAAPLAAQSGLSGSESYTMAARAVPTGSAAASSGSYRALLGVGLAPSSEPQSSESFGLVAGVMAFDGMSAAAPPTVIAVVPSKGDKDGGEAVSVLGVHLVDGIGPSTVSFAGSPVVPSSASGVHLQVQAPPGTNVWGNPLGPVDVRVSHLSGVAASPDPYVYTPALVQDAPAHVGQLLEVTWHGPPGSLQNLSYGKSVGFGVPIPPLEGALEIVSNLVQLAPLTLSLDGEETYQFAIPDDGALTGFVVELQGVALTSLAPLSGSFTNKLDVTIEP